MSHLCTAGRGWAPTGRLQARPAHSRASAAGRSGASNLKGLAVMTHTQEAGECMLLLDTLVQFVPCMHAEEGLLY